MPENYNNNKMKRLSLFSSMMTGLCLIILGSGACKRIDAAQSAKAAGSIKILETIEVDSVIADFPVGFASLTTGDWQFIAYYNKHRDLTVAARKTTDPKWNYKILPTKVGWDSHNRITMAMDRENCLHLSGNMHNDTLIYFKTERAFDIATFKKVFPLVAAEDESRCTYPKFIKNAAGALIYSYRKGGSGNGVTISNIYHESSQSFQRLTDQPLFDGLKQMSAYASGPMLGPDQFFHMLWLWRDTPACETNHDLSYARSRDLISWETLDGQKVGLPLTPLLDELTVDPVPPGGGAINGGAKLFFDANNRPLIAYMKYDSLGKSQLFLAASRDGDWLIKQVSAWGYRWAFSGSGSITFEIRLQDCYVKPDGRIAIAYQHIKRGKGELIIDPTNLSLLEDQALTMAENSPYPADLLSPSSGIDSATVSWMKMDASPETPSEYYALRWETMGKRRFYKPRNTPVKPSVMKLYRLGRE